LTEKSLERVVSNPTIPIPQLVVTLAREVV